jgi:sulfur carrier protein
MQMQLIVNGNPMDAEEETTLAGLMETLKLDPKAVVAELNGEIVPREEYLNRTLAPEDKVELVRFVGGG